MNDPAKASQAKRILAHMQTVGPINPIQALKEFGCFRLGARIYNLRQAGHAITSTTVVAPNGKRFKEYSLGLSEQERQDVAKGVADWANGFTTTRGAA